ncbi:MAG TPA: hypothetical protein PLT98_04370 [Thauera aminoaromatica]|nr:hypothetical protein [Thauera aminoaromatica]
MSYGKVLDLLLEHGPEVAEAAAEAIPVIRDAVAYARSDSRDPSYELELGRRMIRAAARADAQRAINGGGG